MTDRVQTIEIEAAAEAPGAEAVRLGVRFVGADYVAHDPRALAASWRQFAGMFAVLVLLNVLAVVGPAVLLVPLALFAVPVLVLLTAAAFENWQLRTGHGGTAGEWLAAPAEWWPVSEDPAALPRPDPAEQLGRQLPRQESNVLLQGGRHG